MDPAEQRGEGLAAADAHRDDAEFEVAADEILRDPEGEDGSGGADGVAECDGAAVGVGVVRVDGSVAGWTDTSRRSVSGAAYRNFRADIYTERVAVDSPATGSPRSAVLGYAGMAGQNEPQKPRRATAGFR